MLGAEPKIMQVCLDTIRQLLHPQLHVTMLCSSAKNYQNLVFISKVDKTSKADKTS